jgi:ketosteroid isomerase-like protein
MSQGAAVERVSDYLGHLHAGRWDKVGEFFSEDVVWHVGGNHALSGDYRGRDALLDYFAKVRDQTGGSLTVTSESILASDRHTAMFTRVTAQRDGRSLDVTMAQVLSVGADGNWREYWALANDQAAVDAFWS